MMGDTTGAVWTKRLLVVLLVLVAVTGLAAADGNNSSAQRETMKTKLTQIADFLTFMIGAVAIPNGAYGLFEYMTAGTDTESTQKGKKRIRNSFIAIGGASIIQIAVKLLANQLGLFG